MIVITIISLIIYAVSILMIYTNTYHLEKDKRIKYIIIGIIAVLLITYIIVLISSSGIQVENKEYLKITKRISTWLFAPVNSIIILPYLGNVLNKYKSNALSEEKFKKRFIIIAILIVILMFFEVGYIKNFQIGLIQNATR